jgi:hypothetical protein
MPPEMPPALSPSVIPPGPIIPDTDRRPVQVGGRLVRILPSQLRKIRGGNKIVLRRDYALVRAVEQLLCRTYVACHAPGLQET